MKITGCPTNVTFAAVELHAAYRGKIPITPYRAAVVATELCRLGARYKRLSERLCGGEEEWGRYPGAEARIDRAHRARTKLRKQAENEIAGWGKRARIESSGDGLRLDLVTIIRAREERTTLTRD